MQAADADAGACVHCGSPAAPDATCCADCGDPAACACACGAFAKSKFDACDACGRRPWTRSVVARTLRRRSAWALVGASVVAIGTAAFFAFRPDEATRSRRLREAAATVLVEGDPTEAATLLEACVRRAPTDARAWALLAAARFARGRAAAAAQAADRAWKLNPTLPGAASLLARCRLAAGDPRGALAAARDGSDADARVLEARSLAAMGRPAAAAAALERIYDASLDDLGALAWAARVAADLGGRPFPGAAKQRERAQRLAHVLDARATARAEARPDDSAAALAVAVASSLDPKADAAVVLRQFERASSLGAVGADACAARVEFLVRADRRDDARAFVDLLAARGDVAAADACAALLRAGDADGAAVALRTLVEKSPKDAAVRASLVRALVAAKRPADAVREAGDAPDAVELCAAKADAAAAAGDRATADACYDAALALRPDDPTLLVARHAPSLARLVEARAARREPTADETAAARALELAMKIDPDDVVALAWAARLADADGRVAEAFHFARRRARETPDSFDARAASYDLGCAGASDAELDELAKDLVAADDLPIEDCRAFAECALRRGRRAAALRVVAAGAQKWPKDDALRALHARALLATGDPRGAETLLVESAGAAPTSGELRELLAWARGLSGDVAGALATLPTSDAPADVVARADLLIGLGRLDEADAVLRPARAARPSDEALLRAEAEALLARGESTKAADLLESAANAGARDVATLSLLGHALAAAFPDSGVASGRLAALRERLSGRPESAIDLTLADARLAAAAGDRATAGALFDRYLARRPVDARAWYEAARFRGRAGDEDGAVAALRRAVEISPGLVEARGVLAKLLYARAAKRFGIDADARVALDEIVKLAPEWTEPRARLAVALFDDGLPDLSAAQCRAILERDPTNVVARLVVATGKNVKGDVAGALADFDSLVAERPTSASLKLQRGLLRLRAGRAADAAVDFRDAAAGGASGADLEYGLAGCAVFDRRADDALAHARRAVELAPDAASAHRALGEALALDHQDDAAVGEWNAAFQRDPTEPSPIVAAATLLARAGKWRDALAETDRVGRPAGAALALRAEALYRVGRVEEARAAFERAGPDHPVAWVRAGELAEERRDVDGAARAYRCAIDAGVADARTRFKYGALSLAQGKSDVARATFEKLLAESPDDANVLNDLALALAASWNAPPAPAEADARRKALERPIALASRARRILPQSADVADTLGWVRWLAGDVDDARALFDEAVRVSAGRCADALYHAALDDLRRDRNEPAKAGLRAALKIAGPEAPWAERARALLETSR